MLQPLFEAKNVLDVQSKGEEVDALEEDVKALEGEVESNSKCEDVKTEVERRMIRLRARGQSPTL